MEHDILREINYDQLAIDLYQTGQHRAADAIGALLKENLALRADFARFAKHGVYCEHASPLFTGECSLDRARARWYVP